MLAHDQKKRGVNQNCEEWRIRVDLAACYRLVEYFCWTDLIYNHITARVPGTDEFLINPYGMLYSEIVASCFYRLNFAGTITYEPNTDYGVNLAGQLIHSAIHRARPDVGCVIHTHSRAGVAVSAMEQGLLPVTQNALRFDGRLAYHDYTGPETDAANCAQLVQDLGDLDAMILRNHGLRPIPCSHG